MNMKKKYRIIHNTDTIQYTKTKRIQFSGFRVTDGNWKSAFYVYKAGAERRMKQLVSGIDNQV
jgi:hypothetical protein